MPAQSASWLRPLRREPPLRIVASVRRNWLLLAGHHFAFDGLGMVSILRALLSGESEPAPDYSSLDSSTHSIMRTLSWVFRPAEVVAPSASVPTHDSFANTEVALSGRGITAGLARACAAAIVFHNAEAGRPLQRIGISVAVGGVDGQSATYRRVDVSAVDEVEEAVSTALADPSVPAELKGLPPGAFLLQPLLRRFSDTFLVSNLGRLDCHRCNNWNFTLWHEVGRLWPLAPRDWPVEQRRSRSDPGTSRNPMPSPCCRALQLQCDGLGPWGDLNSCEW